MQPSDTSSLAQRLPRDILLYLLQFLELKDVLRVSTCAKMMNVTPTEQNIVVPMRAAAAFGANINGAMTPLELWRERTCCYLHDSTQMQLERFPFSFRATNAVNAIRMVSDNIAAIGSDDRTVSLHDINTGTSVSSHALDSCVNSIRHFKGTTHLFVATEKSVSIWDFATATTLHIDRTHIGTVWDVEFADYNQTIGLSCGSDGSVRIWDLSRLYLIRTLKEREACAAYSVVPLQLPGAKAAIAVCRDRTGVISFLDPYQSGKILMQTDYTIHTAGVRDIIQLDEWHLASGGYDDTMVVWDIRTCKPVFRGSGSVQCFAKSNPGELFTLAVGQRDGTIKFCGFEASHPNGSVNQEHQPGPTEALFVGRVLADAHKSGVRAVEFTSDHRFLSGSSDGTVKLWGPSLNTNSFE